MNRPWRWLPPAAGEAAVHMATDEAIFRAYEAGLVPPTLRCYTWSPPGVSIGRFQDAGAEIDLAACEERGYAVVRRPTGGRAVLHQGDLTYAVILGSGDGLPAGTLPAYLHISRGLVAGLRLAGLDAELYTPEGKGGGRNPACFASPSWYELTVGGRKVAGSAQRRDGGDVLQHGAILLDFSPEDLAAILRSRISQSELAAQLSAGAGGLREFIPSLQSGELAGALRRGFAEAFGVEIREGILSAAEEEMVRDLIPKYANLEPAPRQT